MSKKEAFRKECLSGLKKESQRVNSYANSKNIVFRLYKAIQTLNPKTISLYIPLENEVDTYGLIKRLRQQKKIIYVPFMEGKSFRLVQYRLPLMKKKFGIKEPKNSYKYRKKKLDLIIVPIVGVDKSFKRIGFGQGMFDRFFEKEKKNIQYTIFTAKKLYVCEEIITDKHDIDANLIIT